GKHLMTLAEKFDGEYDGSGTYWEDPNGEDGEEGDDEDNIDEDDDGVRHYAFLAVARATAFSRQNHG
ncbi:hypothetical protein ACVGV6_01605, partial [Enterobacter sichuanensis]